MSDEAPSSRSTMSLRQAIDVYGAESALLRHLNRNEVLRYLRVSGEAHGISAIAKETQLSRPTVDIALTDLINRGLVVETAQSASSPRGGRPAREFQFAARSGCIAAVTLTSHELAVVVADLRDKRVGKTRTTFANLNREPDPVECLGVAVDQAVSECSFTADQLQVVVIGIRGIVSPDGVLQTSSELHSLVGDEVHRRLQDRFPCPVLLENDANLAALAEHRNLGGPADFVGLLIHDAVGCGLVLNGELHRGAHGAAGEFFGDRRTIRPWASTNAEIGRYANGHGLGFGDVFSASKAGPGEARSLVSRYATDIADLIRELMVLDPPVIVVGGEIVNAGDVFMSAFRQALDPVYSDTEIVFSDLGADCLPTGALQVAADWMDRKLFHV